MRGKLVCEKGTTFFGSDKPGIAEATIYFSGNGAMVSAGDCKLQPCDYGVKTDSNGNYFFSPAIPKGIGLSFQAHFVGATLPGPNGVPVFFTGSDSKEVYIPSCGERCGHTP